MSAGAVVVTVVHGRHDHLLEQRKHLARCRPAPACHVVVSMDDDALPDLLAEQPGLPTALLRLPATPGGLPVAAARNAGAQCAIERGASELIFLDVDCVPGRGLIDGYAEALRARPGALVCGPVTYLPPAPAGGLTARWLTDHRAPHPARPDPPAGQFAAIEPDLFWSLSFAARPDTWTRLGGFFEGYVGYGGEDTDLAFTAAASGVDIVFVGGVDAYHQHHETSDPPVQHLDDIVRNSAIFRRRHGMTPMTGWLAQFREKGLVDEVDGLPRRTDAIRLLTVPARHPYLDAALPTTVDRVRTDRVVAWEPDPMLSAPAFAAVADEVDVVHVHFSFEHLSPGSMRSWLDGLERTGTPLVLTVHDLHNPHVRDPKRHLEHLRLLASRAARVLTLTDSAAESCVEVLGLRPDVVPHPTLLDRPPVPGSRGEYVLVPVKALRANVVDAPRLVRVTAETASSLGLRTRVVLDPAAARHSDFAQIRAFGEQGDIEVVPAGHVPHDEVVAAVAAARAMVLPYRFGTHSGWVELAHDVGTPVAVPDCGAYRDQWDAVRVFGHNERDGLDDASLREAVRAACTDDVAPAGHRTRMAQRDLVRATHEAVYRSVLDG